MKNGLRGTGTGTGTGPMRLLKFAFCPMCEKKLISRISKASFRTNSQEVKFDENSMKTVKF